MNDASGSSMADAYLTALRPTPAAVARAVNLEIVTVETPTGTLQRPNIPDVCTALQMLPCIPIIGVIRAEKWVDG